MKRNYPDREKIAQRMENLLAKISVKGLISTFIRTPANATTGLNQRLECDPRTDLDGSVCG